ncbi:hypothetical protein QBC47DRAFT_115148 [Echria macrotheca]|uniref:Zn(2)-C6 fungal-type domain-containing protein n=1 Tax=Echria macrotheca TaxID=438768 RepID=A0AAJ0BKQ8_9PEZI|nr:hypothetical protein QBC47DRAFT_115148 [Echria macrotheca]
MEDVKAAASPEGDDGLQQHGYPLGSTASSHFYHLQRDADMEHDPGSDELVQQALASLAEHQEQEKHHNQEHEDDLRDLRALQDAQPEDPQQQPSGPQHHRQPTEFQNQHGTGSIDELRLAVQLSREIAPTMDGANAPAHNQAHGLPMPQQNTQPPEMQQQSSTSAEIQQQLQAQLQKHDRELESTLPPPEHGPGHHFETPNPSPVPNMAMAPMEAYHPAYPLGDNTPPRKRSKVSRACDECRRKKIKCDAQADIRDQPCSNCKRSASQCQFSRVPQKRGPNKGYIKELADRINSIEGKLGESAAKRASVDPLPSPFTAEESRKRPFSDMDADAEGSIPLMYPADNKLLRMRPLYLPPSGPRSLSVNNLAPKPTSPSSLPEGIQIPSSTEPSAVEPTQASILMDELLPTGPVALKIDDVAFDCYLRAIHPTFPILASTKERVQSVLGQCPLALQDAFCLALFELTHPFTSEPSVESRGSAPIRILLNKWEVGPRRWPESSASKLVYFQILIMMALDSTHRDRNPADDVILPETSEILGRAIGVGLSMNTHRARPDLVEDASLDLDSIDNVALRAWFSLAAFDRWYAVARGKPVILSEDLAVMSQGVRKIMDEDCFYIFRLSEVVAAFVPVVQGYQVGVKTTDAQAMHVFHKLVSGLLNGVRLSLPDNFDEEQHPLLHLVYWYTALLVHLISPKADLPVIPEECEQIFRILARKPPPQSPITYDISVLAAAILTKLTGQEEAHDDVSKIMGNFLADPDTTATPVWNGLMGAARALTANVNGQSADGGGVQNLQQLADVATGGGAQAEVSNGSNVADRFHSNVRYNRTALDILKTGHMVYWDTICEAPADV